MSRHEFISFLRDRILQPLPGSEAQLRMAPLPLDERCSLPMAPERRACVSRVMVLLCTMSDGRIDIVLTLRSESILHGGQISFPGGRAEAGERAVDTALRETEEETGIRKQKISVIGNISELYVHRSNHMVTPVLGSYSGKPEFRINPEEVQEAFTIPLDALVSEKHLAKESWTLQDTLHEVPYWNIHHVPLWGATAMILSEILVLYGEYLKDRDG
ncbi:MAG: CoA pyrophosphatase [Balneolaceae bacterium]